MADRYSLTRPIYKDGSNTFYWDVLTRALNGITYSRQEIDEMGKYMTFQALVEDGLLKNVNHVYELTPKGAKYIKFHQNKFDGIKHETESFNDIIIDTTATLVTKPVFIHAKREKAKTLSITVIKTSGDTFSLDFDSASEAELAIETINKSINVSAFIKAI